MRTTLCIISFFLFALIIKLNAQSASFYKNHWQRFHIDSTNLSLLLPETPRKVDLSDLPSWFHSQSGNKYGYVAKTSNLNIVISCWFFTSFFEADIAMRGIQSGAAFINSKITISTSYDEENNSLVINSYGNIGPAFKIKRFSKSFIVGTRSWLVEVDCTKKDSIATEQAHKILDSINLTFTQKKK